MSTTTSALSESGQVVTSSARGIQETIVFALGSSCRALTKETKWGMGKAPSPANTTYAAPESGSALSLASRATQAFPSPMVEEGDVRNFLGWVTRAAK